MALIGYARVSSDSQSEALQQQLEALKKYKCDPIRQEVMSGTSKVDRRELNTILDFIGKGDSLVVIRLDRLARSLKDLLDIVEQLETKGAKLVALNHNIDTGSATGRAFLGMLGVFAEFETELRKERQMEGIRRAQTEGKYKGRQYALTAAQVKDIEQRLQSGEKQVTLAEKYKVTRQTISKVAKGEYL